MRKASLKGGSPGASLPRADPADHTGGKTTDPRADPSLSGGPQSWHGLIHGLAFLLLVLSLLLSFLLLWWRLRTDPLWRGYDLYTIITAVLYVVLFFLSASQWAFYLFLAVVLAWVEVMAIRLRYVAEGSRAQQLSRVE